MLNYFLLFIAIVSVPVLTILILSHTGKVKDVKPTIRVKFIFSGDGVTIEDADEIKQQNWSSYSTQMRFITNYLYFNYDFHLENFNGFKNNLINCKLKRDWSASYTIADHNIDIVVEFLNEVYL